MAGLKERLIARGRKWTGLAAGMHHVAYRGLAFRFKETAQTHIKFSVRLSFGPLFVLAALADVSDRSTRESWSIGVSIAMPMCL